MHPAVIKAALETQGYKQVDLARAAKVSHSVIHDVIYGRSRSRRIERLISQATRIPLHELWPSYYRAPKHAA